MQEIFKIFLQFKNVPLRAMAEGHTLRPQEAHIGAQRPYCPKGITLKTMFYEFLECNLKPSGIICRILLDILFDILDSFVFIRLHFCPINNRCCISGANENMVELMLGETLHHVRLVDKAERLFELALHPHLLHQTAFCGILQRLAVTRMAAAGVGPQARSVVFCERTLLEQHLPFAVEDENREGTVQRRVDVSGLLLHQSNWIVLIINEDDVFGHKLHVESDIDDVTVFHHVVLSFNSEFSSFFHGLF